MGVTCEAFAFILVKINITGVIIGNMPVKLKIASGNR
ncbi:hypothetical protein FHS68_000062 [Dyadobacter arcticus]|uniref:Uncharacterized protein n=1 Tax=Dyadobacter arcticus TaxID=1078754 RepID=A0ABX0UD28_9BACT|nr:hypothetical protein [Dyadobacter arcticus]